MAEKVVVVHASLFIPTSIYIFTSIYKRLDSYAALAERSYANFQLKASVPIVLRLA